MSKSWVWLVVIFLLVLVTRLFFAFQTPFYSGDDAYLHLRQTESLLEGKLLLHDPLGYGGRTLIISPVLDAILAFFSLIMPLSLVLKILPNIFASLLVIPAFLISYTLTKHKPISLFTAILASFVPAFFAYTFNHISTLALALPLFFFLTYAWLKVPKFSWVMTFLLLLLIFVFMHPLSIIFVLSIGVYIALISIEHLKPKLAEYELGLFSIFFALWAQFLIYKKLILFHGPAVIWRNIPKELLSSVYSSVTVLGAIWQIGILPLLGGVYALYKTAFKSPQKETHILLSIVIVSTIMLWFKLIELVTGFMLLGITLSILFGSCLLLFKKFLKETKFASKTPIIITIIMILTLGTIAYPTYAETKIQLANTITQEEVNALQQLSEKTSEQTTIIAPPYYGNYITAIAKRKNIIDNYFFLQSGINERYQDAMRIYKTSFETEAVELVDKYSATHIIVPPGMKDIRYADGQCFKRIHATSIRIYEKDQKCEVKVVG